MTLKTHNDLFPLEVLASVSSLEYINTTGMTSRTIFLSHAHEFVKGLISLGTGWMPQSGCGKLRACARVAQHQSFGSGVSWQKVQSTSTAALDL